MLVKDEVTIKRMISDLLLELVCSLPNTKGVSPETANEFVYWMGLPDKNQQEMINNKKTDFTTVRDSNLARFTTKDMFEAAETLINKPEIQRFNTLDTKYFGRMLHFSKQILLPNINSHEWTRQQIRNL